MDEFIILIIQSVHYMVRIITIAITIDVLLSWVNIGNNAFTNIIHSITEPILKPFRNLINNSAIGGPGLRLDFSPVLALFALNFLERIIITFLYSLL